MSSLNVRFLIVLVVLIFVGSSLLCSNEVDDELEGYSEEFKSFIKKHNIDFNPMSEDSLRTKIQDAQLKKYLTMGIAGTILMPLGVASGIVSGYFFTALIISYLDGMLMALLFLPAFLAIVVVIGVAFSAFFVPGLILTITGFIKYKRYKKWIGSSSRGNCTVPEVSWSVRIGKTA